MSDEGVIIGLSQIADRLVAEGLIRPLGDGSHRYVAVGHPIPLGGARPVHPDTTPRRPQLLGAALAIATMEPQGDMIETIAGLLELAEKAGGQRGFNVLKDPTFGGCLQCRKYDDTYCHGLSDEALVMLSGVLS